MLKLIIFDFDGLMVNSEHVVFDALKILFKRYVKVLTWTYFCKHIGVPVADSLREFHRDFELPIPFSQFLEERNLIVHQYLSKKLQLIPGIKKIILMLSKKPVTLAIATSGKRTYIEYWLKKFGIEKYFSTIVCIDDVEKGKPHPDLILKTLRVSGFSTDESIIIEDAPSGIEAATKAQIKSIAIPTNGVPLQKFKKATYILDSVADIYGLLSKLTS